MKDFFTCTGMVLRSRPAGENDRLITLLAGTEGKLNVFVRGARKPSSRFAASSETFAFGEFKLSHGTSAYYLNDADISNYFEEFRTDIELAAYASYFAEIADYYCVEGDDSTAMLGLLYASLLALNNPNFSYRLVRCIYVLRSIVLNGEFPGLPSGRVFNEAVVTAVDRIENSDLKHLYTFRLTENAEDELFRLTTEYEKRFMDRHFKSLEVLAAL
ncbi:MAG: DNA repair protein RecO [Lachnospiraceae bacterium]|nr:DNA repair protein RecO [Lachnospiraceae bacterium]MBO7531949.1 DNA repair protein RecO [Lachnospiraceae bacterium]MBP5253161.1 DNA repair protein RecO [Lachnospiraceae bacterium]MBP5763050.1 DNA repair protein RecO [Lachnospiraceae bacterium]